MILRNKELSVRQSDYGDDLLPTVETSGHEPNGISDFAILVHGYNVNAKAARKSYKQFARRLRKEGVSDRFPADMWHFFWPGSSRNPIVSAASYSLRVGTAKEAGKILGQFLEKIMSVPEGGHCTIVAHSLGCRVALEAVTWLCESHHNSVCRRIRLVIAAAAVPVFMVRPWKRLRSGVIGVEHKVALHSSKDGVLKYLFPAGQTLRLEGIFPEAVGHNGEPTRLWGYGSRDMGIGHGEYWEDRRVAKTAARVLGVAVPNELSAARFSAHSIGQGTLGGFI